MSLGIQIGGITAEGDYEVDFNFETNNSSWIVTEPGGASNTTIAAYPNNLGNNVDNKIVFYTADGVKTICGIKNMALGLVGQVLTGGTVGSWSWQGFDENNDSYITWEETSNITSYINTRGRILFTECPDQNPNLTESQDDKITASQYINFPVKKNDRYTVSLNRSIQEGTLSMYYFNEDGFGFRIPDILAGSTPLYDPDVPFTEYDIVIGESIATENDMRQTLVIGNINPSQTTTGWVDDIKMTKNYVQQLDENDQPMFEPKTISFSERVNGWTSFKSFIPETGASVSSKYFTFDMGKIYQHYVPTSPELDGLESNNLIVSYLGLNNAPAWKSSSDTKGWKCSNIITNLSTGSVKEFIEKEGKWFGYINGNTLNTPLDTSRFSVQGVGVVATVSETPITT